jgi:hypothetical protein
MVVRLLTDSEAQRAGLSDRDTEFMRKYIISSQVNLLDLKQKSLGGVCPKFGRPWAEYSPRRCE